VALRIIVAVEYKSKIKEFLHVKKRQNLDNYRENCQGSDSKKALNLF